MSEAIAALIVGGGLVDVAESSRAVKGTLLEEQDFGIAHGIAPVVGNDASDDGAGSEREADVFGVEAGADNDAGPEALMLIKRLRCVAAPTSQQAVLARCQAGEKETAIIGGH